MGIVQPYFRYETVSIEQKKDTSFLSGGLNYYIKGHNAKASLDYTIIKYPEAAAQSVFTLQLAVGI